MVNLVKWIDPESSFEWTHIRIERGPAVGGPFTELTSSDITGYINGTGLPLSSPHITFAKDMTGVSGQYYRIRFFDGTNFSDYSDPMVAFDFRGYCTIDEVRSFTNIQATEYDDGQIQLLIDGVTAEIDNITGRNWHEVQSVSGELLDGTGEELLTLPQGDIAAVSAIAVDLDEDKVYETVLTVASDVYIYYADGYMVLNKSVSPIVKWPEKRQCIQISYTYGNSAPTNDVRHLALLMVANMLCIKDAQTEMIEKKIKILTRRSIQTV